MPITKILWSIIAKAYLMYLKIGPTGIVESNCIIHPKDICVYIGYILNFNEYDLFQV